MKIIMHIKAHDITGVAQANAEDQAEADLIRDKGIDLPDQDYPHAMALRPGPNISKGPSIFKAIYHPNLLVLALYACAVFWIVLLWALAQLYGWGNVLKGGALIFAMVFLALWNITRGGRQW